MADGAQRIIVGGYEFNVVSEGRGEPVLLLHGFPDSSALWRNQIPALVDAGFRVIAPDLRGFGESDKPQAVEDYAMHLLLGDVQGIMDAMDVPRARVVGHDWGAVLSWLLAIFVPERVEKLVALSVGRPGARRRTTAEVARFWYTIMFQFPDVAEEALTRHDWEMFRGWMGASSPDFEKYLADLSRPGALRAALNWYRANLQPQVLLADAVELPDVQVPTLGVWGTGEVALTEDQMTISERHVAATWRYERFENAGHWIPLDQPERLNALLIDFLRAPA